MSCTLYILSGTPGCGKSTFAYKYFKDRDDIWITSRDEIRFSLLKDDDDYFAKETEVYKKFIDDIATGLSCGYSVVADATHLGFPARNKLLSSLNKTLYDEVVCIYFKVPIDICFKRNELRKGTRRYVPKGTIKKMNFSHSEPNDYEGINKIIYVNEKGEVYNERNLVNE